MSDYRALLRELPAVDRLLREPVLINKMQHLPRRLVLQAAQETISAYRQRLSGYAGLAHPPESAVHIDLSPSILAEEAAYLAEKKAGMNLKALINATGIVIHTNLGRVPLASKAIAAINDVANNYSNLEISLDTGERGSRQEHLEKLLCDLTGAEAAVVVNNNAAAVFLTLNALAAGREIVVSRGQLVEIGGSFRIPEIMAASGAALIEVGTTNKTYLKDYEAVVNDNTAAFLKVHTSNYHMIGFTAEVETTELASLANKYRLPLVEDLGSGVLMDLSAFGLPAEPLIQESITAGADLVTFSGDKMLGGPQAGIIVGRGDLVSLIRKNQLARALRVDKFTIAALEATLRLYLDPKRALQDIPVWRMLTVLPDDLQRRAENLAEQLAGRLDSVSIEVIEGISRVGGGALPAAELPTYLVALKPLEGIASSAVVANLRRGQPPVILRLQQDRLLIDPRTIREEEETALIDAVAAAWQQ